LRRERPVCNGADSVSAAATCWARAAASRARGRRSQFTHHRNARAGSLDYDLRSTFKIPEGAWDVVICSMPLAKILMDADKPRERARDLSVASAPQKRSSSRPMPSSADGTAATGRTLRPIPSPIMAAPRRRSTKPSLYECPQAGGADQLPVRRRAPHFDKRLGPLLAGAVSSAEQRWREHIP
jgi:hypothetical protein